MQTRGQKWHSFLSQDFTITQIILSRFTKWSHFNQTTGSKFKNPRPTFPKVEVGQFRSFSGLWIFVIVWGLSSKLLLIMFRKAALPCPGVRESWTWKDMYGKLKMTKVSFPLSIGILTIKISAFFTSLNISKYTVRIHIESQSKLPGPLILHNCEHIFWSC